MATAKLVIVARVVAAFWVFLATTSVVQARHVHLRSATPFGAARNGGNGFQGQLFKPSVSKDLSLDERILAEIEKSHARASSLGAMIAAGGSNGYDSRLVDIGGSFAMTFAIGTPPQIFSCTADTGSDLVWVQSLPCVSCYPQTDNLYDPSKTSTFKKLHCSSSYCQYLPEPTCSATGVKTCPYIYEYGDLSETRGYLSTESVTLTPTSGGLTTVSNFVFGYGNNNTGFGGVDGLVGLGRGPLSFTSQLGVRFSNIFSYCLVPFSSATAQPSPIYFGDAAVPAGGNITYTPLLTNPKHPTFYYVKLLAVTMGGKKLDIPSSVFEIDSKGKGGVLFDSGTTLTYLPQVAYEAIKKAFQSVVTYPSAPSPAPQAVDLCYASPNTTLPIFPPITFNFDGTDLVLPGENTFIDLGQFSPVYCLGMSASPFSLGIFGNIQQANFNIIYDRDNSRLGFQSTQCGALA